VLIRLVGGIPKLSLSQNCDIRELCCDIRELCLESLQYERSSEGFALALADIPAAGSKLKDL